MGEAEYDIEATPSVQEEAKVLLAERLRMRGAPFFPLPPTDSERRRISETCARVDSYMYTKHRTSAPDLHQVAGGGSRPGSGRVRRGSGCGLHTPGGGNIKIFSAQLPDFSHVKSQIDSSPPAQKESAQSQRRYSARSTSLQARSLLKSSSHSKLLDHSHARNSVTSPLRKSSQGEMTSSLAGRKKSTSELTGRNKSTSEVAGRNKSASEVAGRNKSTSEVAGRNKSASGLGGRNKSTSELTGRIKSTSDFNGRKPSTPVLSGSRKPSANQTGERGDTSKGRSTDSSEKSDHFTGLLTPPRKGALLTQSDTSVVQELSAIRRAARAKVDTGTTVTSGRDLFCSVAELTDRESFSMNVRFMLRPQLVAAIFKRRRSFSEIDSSATLDRRKDVQRVCLNRSKSLNDLATVMDMGADHLTPGRASTLPHSQWQSHDVAGNSHIPSRFSGNVTPSEARYVEGSEDEGTDSEKEEADFVDRKVSGSHIWGYHGDSKKVGNHKPGVPSTPPTVVVEGGRGASTTPTNTSKADKSAVKCKRKPQQQKMALPLSLRRYTNH